jgi:hypothetical protein
LVDPPLPIVIDGDVVSVAATVEQVENDGPQPWTAGVRT